MREIYGIERKAQEELDNADDDDDDDDDETMCVVCMSESMDTMVLPCRHLCLCNDCAEVLRFQVCVVCFEKMILLLMGLRRQASVRFAVLRSTRCFSSESLALKASSQTSNEKRPRSAFDLFYPDSFVSFFFVFEIHVCVLPGSGRRSERLPPCACC